MEDEAATVAPRSRTPAESGALSEQELSRIAREAVRQGPDPRLDKQLARMGLGGDAQPSRSARPGDAPSAEIAGQLDALARRLARAEAMVVVLAIVVAALAVGLTVLLVR